MATKTYGWDKGAEIRLRNLKGTHERAIPVLGGAIFATTALRAGDLQAFARYLLNVPSSIGKSGWPGGVEDALNTFCHVCLVDPKLIEVYLGTTFAEIAQAYT